ncbi:ModE family transcriptional regulator [Malaciobacter molluscorum]|uniref:ModE family transcriptional regulator n=1 Tax=Malaciobacter molluscorum TaxID=1032072 RepID=UPI00100B8378|nr:ModE family transcriptional regulator [Malaciobacter molluscorum]RXJ96464.1 ModE family transcriptional regulator [Malaciobacter molluscorum]
MKRLDNIQTELLMTNLDEDGKLSCLKAFRVAKLIGINPKDMQEIIKNMDITITNCELDVSNNLSFLDINDDIYNALIKNIDKEQNKNFSLKEALEKDVTIDAVNLNSIVCKTECF